MSHNGETMPLDYKQQLTAILQSPEDPQRGAEIAEIRKSMRVLDALDRSGTTLTLEDADYEYMKHRILSARYLIVNQAIMDFIEDVTNAPAPTT